MKVNGTGPGSAGSTDSARGTSGADAIGSSRARRSRGSPDEEGSDSSEKIAISGRARDVAKAHAHASAASDIDEERVARLKAAIQSGSYKVDADKVADRLVDEHIATAF